jgi:hypothetical protein
VTEGDEIGVLQPQAKDSWSHEKQEEARTFLSLEPQREHGSNNP